MLLLHRKLSRKINKTYSRRSVLILAKFQKKANHSRQNFIVLILATKKPRKVSKVFSKFAEVLKFLS